MKLSQFAQGRDNNFNLIRVVAALAVLFSHCFWVVKFAGTGNDPVEDFFGVSHEVSMGSIAVDVFFITSGFLVTGSLLARKGTLKFVWARLLRIYPALVVVVCLMVFGLGLYFTTYPAGAFLANRQTLVFALMNSTLIGGGRFFLPGVFASNPAKGFVNVPLWTMIYELRMYALLAVMWPLLSFFKALRVKLFNYAVVLIAGSALLVRFATHYYFHSSFQTALFRLLYLFFIGATYFVLKERIILSRTIFLAASAALLVSVLNFGVFFAVYPLVLPYILFWIAYVPGGFIRSYNRLGDYSYGVYIYSYPIQQSIVALNPGISLKAVMLYAFVVTMFFAILSWHLIEKHALSLKGSYAKAPRKVIEPLSTTQPMATP